MGITVQTFNGQQEDHPKPKAFEVADLRALEERFETFSWPDCFGRHVILDCSIEHAHRFVEAGRRSVEKEMKAAALAANASVVDFIPYETRSKNIAVLVLEESHLSVVADKESARVEMFTCGEKANPIAGVRALGDALGATQGYAYVLPRGTRKSLENISTGEFTVSKFDSDEPIEEETASRLRAGLTKGEWNLDSEPLQKPQTIQVISDIRGCLDKSNELCALATFRDRGEKDDPFTRFDTWSVDEHLFPAQGFTSYIIGEDRLGGGERSGDIVLGAFHTWPEEMNGLVLADISVVSDNPVRDAIAAHRKLVKAFGPSGGALHVVRREI